MTSSSALVPTSEARLLDLGDGAFTLELGRTIERETHERVLAIADALEALRAAGQIPGVEEWVASFSAITVHFDPDLCDARALGAHLLSIAAQGERAQVAGLNWTLPACFDEDFAPDLQSLAQARNMAPQEVIDILTHTPFRTYTIGFLPGFPYLGGLPDSLNLPRLSTPRAAVPARSIAVAGAMCAVYPWVSPGGWHLLGKCPVPMFDPSRTIRPALLAPGDIVRWRPVDRASFEAIAAEADSGTLDLCRFQQPESPA